MTHLSGHDRSQLLLLPEAVDDYVGPDNPCASSMLLLSQLLDTGVAFDENYLVTSGAIITYRKATNWVRSIRERRHPICVSGSGVAAPAEGAGRIHALRSV
jgi:hypothetical protein